MPHKIKLLLFTIISGFAVILFFCWAAFIKINLINSALYKNKTPDKTGIKEREKDLRFERIGEKMTYDVILGHITLGKAKFNHIDNIISNGQLLNVITFETKLPRFIDTEIIYTDPETLLPVKIKRDILNWFSREKIIEEYDQKEFIVTIHKEKGGQKKDSVIKKDSPIHNAILLPHLVRRVPQLLPGMTWTANLPNRRYEIKLVSIENIHVPAGTFKTYHFESTPKQIEIWISADDRRIPVKIQSTATFGYLMVLRDYTFEKPTYPRNETRYGKTGIKRDFINNPPNYGPNRPQNAQN